MRALRTTLAAAALLGAVPAAGHAQSKQIEAMLALKPTQGGFDYDTPADKAACKLELVYNKDKKPIGYVVRDGQGQVVRKVVDNNGIKDPKTGAARSDQWSYFKDGFEVYREIDLDDDGALDEARWLNSAGTRLAVLKGGRVVAWKRLSAEEASKVLVQALVSGDGALLESVLATPDELRALGVPKPLVDAAEAAAPNRLARMKALSQALGASGWDAQTTWHRFDGTMPHVIPADAADLKSDLVLYENAAVFAGPPNGQGNPLDLAYLQVPELVKVGDVWKFVDLPHAVDPKKPTPPPTAAVALRTGIYRDNGPGAASSNAELEASLKKLAAYDAKLMEVQSAGNARALAEFHYNRMPILQEVIKATGSADERLPYDKEVVNSLAAAYQTGQYPDGGKMLDRLIAGGGKVGTFAQYRKLIAEFNKEADTPNTNLLELQKDFLAKLDGFLKDHPDADEVPEVLFQLASGSEFNAAEDEARTYYGRLAKDYGDTEAGKKAAGALKRLDLVGKPIELAGPTADGRKVDAAAYKGKTLLVVFWSSAAPQFRNDVDRLVKLSSNYKDKGLEVVGVNLDNTREEMDAFLKENPLPWPQIHEDGGMDGPLADQYGILALPTMFLVDPSGQVVSRSLRTPAEIERLLDKPLAGRADGVGALK